MSQSDAGTFRWLIGPLTRTSVGFGTAMCYPIVAHGQLQFDLLFEEPTPWPGVTAMLSADLDGDGWNDIAHFDAEVPGVLRVLFNDRRGGFTDFTTDVVPDGWVPLMLAGDVDQNGTTDLVYVVLHYPLNHQVNVFYNEGDGRTGRVEVLELANREIANAVLADLTGDGFPELLVIEGGEFQSESALWAFRNHAGRLETAQVMRLPLPEGTALVAGDFDGDGDRDVAAVLIDRYWYPYEGWKTTSSELMILENSGRGSFSLSQRLSLPYRDGMRALPLSLVAGDLDGDGDLDLAVGVTGAQMEVAIMENSGSGLSFALHSRTRFGAGNVQDGGGLGVVDLDTDGLPDLVLTDELLSEVWLLQNVGNLAFITQRMTTPVRNTVAASLAEVTGDGRVDMVIGGNHGSLEPGAIQVYFNATPHDGPTLDHTALRQGQDVILTVTNARPFETAHFLGTLQGVGNSLGQPLLGGIVLDLLDPIILFGSATADANGTAVLRRVVPPNAPLTTVVTQAVIRRGPGGEDSVKTPFRTARIEPN